MLVCQALLTGGIFATESIFRKKHPNNSIYQMKQKKLYRNLNLKDTKFLNKNGKTQMVLVVVSVDTYEEVRSKNQKFQKHLLSLKVRSNQFHLVFYFIFSHLVHLLLS